MDVSIPDKLKEDVPQTTWGKILTGTPVVMAVVATMLAGLSSSEMTSAQYDRSLGAQQQSKAGDQWSFFQAKRLRGAYQENTYELIQNIAETHPFDAGALRHSIEQLPELVGRMEAQVKDALQRETAGESDAPRAKGPARAALERYLQASAQRESEASTVKKAALALLESEAGRKAMSLLESGAPPEPPPAIASDAQVKAALDAVNSTKSESEVAPVIARVGNGVVDEALRSAKARAAAFDDATKPVNDAIARLQNLVGRQSACLKARPDAGPPDQSVAEAEAASRDFEAACLRYAALRYESEARLNQAIGYLYEIQVRKSNFTAERHHKRSENFFYGMLGAQLGVIVSTFAIAARQRSLLWVIAAAAGLVAVAFAIYVYLYV